MICFYLLCSASSSFVKTKSAGALYCMLPYVDVCSSSYESRQRRLEEARGDRACAHEVITFHEIGNRSQWSSKASLEMSKIDSKSTPWRLKIHPQRLKNRPRMAPGGPGATKSAQKTIKTRPRVARSDFLANLGPQPASKPDLAGERKAQYENIC